MRQIFQTASTIDSVSTRVDNTLKIVLSSQELAPEESAQLFALKGKLGWLLFSENELDKTDIPQDDAPEVGGKSPSKRLHDRMLAYWIKKNGNTKGFRTWYEESLDSIGQKYLDKIEN